MISALWIIIIQVILSTDTILHDGLRLEYTIKYDSLFQRRLYNLSDETIICYNNLPIELDYFPRIDVSSATGLRKV